MDINDNLLQAGREKIIVKGNKRYLSVVIYRKSVRPLHHVVKTASDAQEYSERFIKKWKELHAD
jgi:hypothetical protein